MDVVIEEIAAQYAGTILSRDDVLSEMAEKEPGALRKLFDEIKKFLEDIKEYILRLAKHDKTAAAALRKDAKEAAELAERITDALENEIDFDTGKKYSYVGEVADTADKTMLQKAKEMLEDGVLPETIRKETGWFKGMDGKWRFEISDIMSKLIEKPMFTVHGEDEDTYYTATLDKIFVHGELFKAYPQLKNILVIVQPTEPGVSGAFFEKANQIVLSLELFKRYTNEYYDYLNGGRKAEIERIEQTEEYKEYSRFFDQDMDDVDPVKWLEEEEKARDKFFSSELGKRYYQLNWGNVHMKKYEPGWSKEAKSVLLHEIQHAVQEIEGFASGGDSQSKEYDKLAGEIEARDVSARMNLTAEQRKEKRPDIDRTDVVFVGENGVQLFAKEVYNPETATIKQQLEKSNDILNKMDVIKSIEIENVDFKSKQDAKKWAKNELKKWGGIVDRQNFGKIFFSDNDINSIIEHIDDKYQQQAICLLPYVLKKGIKIGEHNDHKARTKHTVTFAAPISINGTRGNMAVVVNMNGNHAYSERVLLPDGTVFVFSEKKETPEGIYQGVLKNESLADTTDGASKISISDSPEKSNRKNEKNSSSHQSLQTSDAEYMDAVERGDMEIVQRMVEEAARKAGYTAKVYHGTENGKGFTVFNTPAYTTSSRDVAKTYSSEGKEDIYGLFVNTDGFLEITDSEYNRRINIPKELAGQFFSSRDFKDGVQTDEIVEAAKKEGYKGVIFRHIYDNGFNNWQWVKTGKMFLGREEEVAVTPGASDVYAVFDPERLKSADPVTYDDNGNVIPLSARFNPEKTDIRYSKQTSRMGAEDVAAMVDGNEEPETQVGIMRDIAVTAARGIAKQMLGANWSRDKAMPKDKAPDADTENVPRMFSFASIMSCSSPVFEQQKTRSYVYT